MNRLTRITIFFASVWLGAGPAFSGAAKDAEIQLRSRDGQLLQGEIIEYDFEAKKIIFETASGRKTTFPAKHLELQSKFELVFGHPTFFQDWRAWIEPKLKKGEFPQASKRRFHAVFWVGLAVVLALIARFCGGWFLAHRISAKGITSKSWKSTWMLGVIGWVIPGCIAGVLLEPGPLFLIATIGGAAVIHAILVRVMYKPKFSSAILFPLGVHAAMLLSFCLSVLLPLAYGMWKTSDSLGSKALDHYITTQWFELLEMM
ncbi:MAG: hypothetical protein ACI8UO_005233 [Verrucomicrobiales bacterium]|jgi:hypothetical protein